MSKLLETRLPFSQGENVSSATFNRLIRILELNLDSFDPDVSPHYNADEISSLSFATGAIIFNTTNEIHQHLMSTQEVKGTEKEALQGKKIKPLLGPLKIPLVRSKICLKALVIILLCQKIQ